MVSGIASGNDTVCGQYWDVSKDLHFLFAPNRDGRVDTSTAKV